MRMKRNCLEIYQNPILSNSSETVILDKESHFPLDPGGLSYRRFYYSATLSYVSPSKRTKTEGQFFDKIVGLAGYKLQYIDEKDNHSDPCFFQGTINDKI